MKKLIFLVGTLTFAVPTHDHRLEDVVAFDHHYVRYLSDLFGCHWKEKGGFDADTCKPIQGTINYSEYQKAREAAKKVFDLGEPKK